MPQSRAGHAMVYDSARKRTVLFGGYSNAGVLSDTWEWDGTQWLLYEPATRPAPRRWHAMAYDPIREVTVLFGGRDDSELGPVFSDTWEWNGINWSLRLPAASPLARDHHAMCYDTVRQKVILFGGRGLYYFDDFWEWDGRAWSGYQVTAGPRGRYGHRMVFDTARRKAVMFGGYGDLGSNRETWELAGRTWTLVSLDGPWLFQDYAMGFDSARGVTVLFGGTEGNGHGQYNETWEWDGAIWKLAQPQTSPKRRYDSAMAYDAARQVMVMCSGTNWVADTWEWNGTNWIARSPGTAPPLNFPIVYDSIRNRMVACGQGESYTKLETWEWDGIRWFILKPATIPPALERHAMAFDSARGRVVLFGGYAFDGTNDTWEWDGVNWEQKKAFPTPRRPVGHLMVFDTARRRTVLFGGPYGNGTETWEWDGSNWIQVLGQAPPQLYEQAMAYDQARRRVVMLGSTIGGGIGGTYVYDGTGWAKKSPTTFPTERHGHAMTYDVDRARVVLFGGVGDYTTLSDTWEWDGATWLRMAPTTSATGHYLHRMAYDTDQHRVMLRGTAYQDATEQWFYGISSSASLKANGNACAGSRGVPVLTSGMPYSGLSSLVMDMSSVRPSSLCIFGFSTLPDNNTVGGGCTLYLKPPIVPLAVMSNGSGFASLKLQVPSDPSLRGGAFHAQAFVVDPQGGPLPEGFLGLAFSRQLALVIGD